MTNIILISRFAAIIDAIQKNGGGVEEVVRGARGQRVGGTKAKALQSPIDKGSGASQDFQFSWTWRTWPTGPRGVPCANTRREGYLAATFQARIFHVYFLIFSQTFFFWLGRGRVVNQRSILTEM